MPARQFSPLDPILHFIWVGVALFVVFFALSTVNNYIGVLMFALVIVVALPLWDRPVTAETNVIDTLWLVWESVVGIGVTMGVELAFAHLRPGDNVIFTVADRLAAVEGVLRCYAKGEPVSAWRATANQPFCDARHVAGPALLRTVGI